MDALSRIESMYGSLTEYNRSQEEDDNEAFANFMDNDNEDNPFGSYETDLLSE